MSQIIFNNPENKKIWESYQPTEFTSDYEKLNQEIENQNWLETFNVMVKILKEFREKFLEPDIHQNVNFQKIFIFVYQEINKKCHIILDKSINEQNVNQKNVKLIELHLELFKHLFYHKDLQIFSTVTIKSEKQLYFESLSNFLKTPNKIFYGFWLIASTMNLFNLTKENHELKEFSVLQTLISIGMLTQVYLNRFIHKKVQNQKTEFFFFKHSAPTNDFVEVKIKQLLQTIVELESQPFQIHTLSFK